jgi:CBS domain-containing protein
MSVDRFCHPIVTARPDNHVGCVVLERDGKPFGIVTDRDVAVRVVDDGLDARTTKAETVATLNPVVVRDVEGQETAARRMREHGVRRLPVVDAGGNVSASRPKTV